LNKVRSFIRRSREVRSALIPEDELTVLRNLGLIDSKAKLAALLLFGRNPQSEIPWAIVKVGKFLSGETMPIFEKEIDGDLIEQIERSYGEVLSLIKREIKIRDLRREEIFEYPLEAVRELIVNAIAHRDYSIRSPIYIRIYDNKIVIESPGGLPPGITVDELKKPHRSVLRNPKIANVLYNLGYIEKWGDLKLFSSSIKL
ncbi:MAG: ATP-binding protein, partial [Candidatus Methanodesulfokora sp.]